MLYNSNFFALFNIHTIVLQNQADASLRSLSIFDMKALIKRGMHIKENPTQKYADGRE